MAVDTTTRYEPVIGLEVHAQLLTRSKMFCSCRADYQGLPPDTAVCPVCLGMPGVLPVINRRAVEYVIMTGLALNCTIAEETKFDRKNYPYPDLMKGYQISQFDRPIASGGWMSIVADGQEKRAGITRVHLEEDVAKLFHRVDPSGETYSLLDVNRSGVPLMEIVGDPDLRSPEEARQYLMKLRTILRYLGVSTGNMEEGSFRCDANISVRTTGSDRYGAKVEVKNMNSFRSVYRALEHEIQRQVQVIAEGGHVAQETRGWVEERGITVSQRSKEYAHDYRYFPEPDLPPLRISRRWVEELRARLPELPEARRDRFREQYGLSLYDATLLTASRATADFFEAAATGNGLRGEALRKRAKTTANWTLTEVARLLNASGKELEDTPLRAGHLAELMDLMEAGTVSASLAKTVLEEAFATGKAPGLVVEERGLGQISDASAIQKAVDEALAANEAAVADYLNGKETAIRFLVGQVMKLTRGQANPALVNRLLQTKLQTLKRSGGLP
ncbi:MAG: Asp-tRNA(Asn)/Glu-tRNA(Gln) amidotransferase subunit GatB [Chloroflexi bacterium]|nr:Asp-tRNA(Asn)/Glu-tRNA(Gln) amidotransferase subunit GatB [Chloroflexota bacterium]